MHTIFICDKCGAHSSEPTRDGWQVGPLSRVAFNETPDPDDNADTDPYLVRCPRHHVTTVTSPGFAGIRETAAAILDVEEW